MFRRLWMWKEARGDRAWISMVCNIVKGAIRGLVDQTRIPSLCSEAVEYRLQVGEQLAQRRRGA